MILKQSEVYKYELVFFSRINNYFNEYYKFTN